MSPGRILPVTLSRPETLAAVGDQTEEIVVAHVVRASCDVPGFDDVHHVGVHCVVRESLLMKDARAVVLEGRERVRILAYQHPCAEVVAHPVAPDAQAARLRDRVVAQAQRLLKPDWQTTLPLDDYVPKDPVAAAFALARILNLSLSEEQALLEQSGSVDMLRSLESRIGREEALREEMGRRRADRTPEAQRTRMYHLQTLHEASRYLAKQGSTQVEALGRQVKEAALPDEVRDLLLEELDKLATNTASRERGTAAWIENVLQMPFEKRVTTTLEVEEAGRVLHAEHVGLGHVKDRVLQHVRVLRQHPGARGPALCFVGPPGVGKTCVARSLARALERPLAEISLGGALRDDLVGSTGRGGVREPGLVMRAISQTGCSNPVVFLDEVDKISDGFRGSAATALIDLLDPVRNTAWVDQYLHVPFDLSQCVFVLAANCLHRIPAALADRLEIVEMPGYTCAEKVRIVKEFMLGRVARDFGLESIDITDEAITTVVKRYTREAGVRELQRCIERMVRSRLSGAQDVRISLGDVPALLGTAPHPRTVRDLAPERPGATASAMAGAAGGGISWLEVLLTPGGGRLHLTTGLGETLKDSVRAALACVSQAPFVADTLLTASDFHVHLGGGGRKDGASGGLAAALAIASASCRRQLRSDTVVTGEISLHGRVLPVSAIRQKLLAAHEEGFPRVLMPRGNERDVASLDDELRAALEVSFVETLEEAWNEMLLADDTTRRT